MRLVPKGTTESQRMSACLCFAVLFTKRIDQEQKTSSASAVHCSINTPLIPVFHVNPLTQQRGLLKSNNPSALFLSRPISTEIRAILLMLPGNEHCETSSNVLHYFSTMKTHLSMCIFFIRQCSFRCLFTLLVAAVKRTLLCPQ